MAVQRDVAADELVVTQGEVRRLWPLDGNDPSRRRGEVDGAMGAHHWTAATGSVVSGQGLGPQQCAVLGEGTRIEHNKILRTPHSAVSVGWGWDYYPMTIAKDNVVIGNRIESFMGHLRDGGGIDFLGPQPNSKVERNYLLDGGNGNGLYPDEGTAFTTWSGNVVDEIDRWLFVWTSSIHDNSYVGNFSVTDNPRLDGTNDAVMNNTIVPDKNWPAAAQAVIDEAGLETAYKDVASAR